MTRRKFGALTRWVQDKQRDKTKVLTRQRIQHPDGPGFLMRIHAVDERGEFYTVIPWQDVLYRADGEERQGG